MKNTLFTIVKNSIATLTLALLIAGPFQPLIAQAQVSCGTAGADPATCIPSGAATIPTTAAGTSPTTGAATPPSQPASDSGCSVFSGSGLALCITNIVYVFTVGIGSGFAYVSAYFFDWAVALSLNGSAYALDFVSQGWTTARDLANMAFLFILLYIAFKIIFSAETGDTIHMLALVIVVALLVNFSFFFTRLAIDAGNILSIQFYNAIQAPSVGSTAQGGGVQGTAASTLTSVTGFSTSKDLTASIMGMLNLQGLFGADSFKNFTSNQTGGSGFLVTLIATSFLYIAAAIMLWLLTVAFITNGVKFLVRIVVLWFLIIASPLAFVARAVPAFEKYYDRWQHELIAHAFYPVAFMFIFLILTNFASQMGAQNNLINGIFNNIPGTPQGASVVSAMGLAVANVAIRMGFVIAMLYIGMRAAGEIGVMGASAAKTAGNWVGGGLLKSYNVGYKRVGPGAWAGAADYALKNSRVGNSALGFELRRYVTKPLAGTTVPGSHGESYLQLKERQHKEGDEKSANIRDIDNKKKIKDIGEKLSKGTAVTDSEKKAVQNLGKREMEAMKTGDMKAIVELFSEDQKKKLDDLKNLSDKDKEDFKTIWEEKAAESPLKKAIKKLDDIAKTSAAAQAAVTTHKATAGPLVDSAWANTLKATLQAQHSAATSAWNAPGARTGPAGAANHAALQSAQEALNTFKEFEENRKKVEPNANINNNGAKGTFKSSLIP